MANNLCWLRSVASAFFVYLLLGGPVAVRALAGDSYYYEVWGTSSREPTRERAWSVPLDTEGEARAAMSDLQRTHGAGGLLEHAADRPTKLHIVKTARPQPRNQSSLGDRANSALNEAKRGLDDYGQAKGIVD